MSARFVTVDVEDGVSLRFKCASEPRAVEAVPYESEDAPPTTGTWRVYALGEDDARGPATAVQVDDSSDGLAWLVMGGPRGLELEHEGTGAIAREPYLLLSIRAALR